MPNLDSIKNKDIPLGYQITDNTFLAVPKDDPKDKIEKEVGDSKVPGEFLPQQKISRWSNECNVSVRLVHDELNPTVETTTGTPAVGKMTKGVMSIDTPAEPDKIVWKGEKVEAHFYELPIDDANPEGASEMEIVLLERPDTNVVSFTIEDKDVEYFKQTEERIQDENGNWNCEENIPGSYAVYAKTPKTNYTGGKEYKVGKIGHIFRPKIIDSVGTEVWGDLHIENGILSVTIPQNFLDKAVYPVRHAAGLTFGYETLGGTNGSDSYNSEYGVKATGLSGTISAITGGFVNTSSSSTNGWAVYAGNSGSAGQYGNLYNSGWTNDNSYGTTPVWRSKSSLSITISNPIYVTCAGKVYTSVRYDTSTGTTHGYYNNKWPDPWVDETTKLYSIYATYTAGGGSAPTVTTQAVSSITDTTATGNGNVTADGGASVTERGVCWGTSSNPTTAGSHASNGTGTGTFTASITSLSAKTHYYVRAYAINSVGTSYGDNVEFDSSGEFVVSDSASSSSSDNVSLTQGGGTLTIADSGSASSSDNVTLVGNLIVADSGSASSADNIVLTFNGGTFSISDSGSASSADNVSLIGNLIIQTSGSTSSADNVTISRNGGDFTVADSGSASSSDNLSLIGNLQITDSGSASSADNVALTRNGGDLSIAASGSTSSADIPALIGNLIITDSGSSSGADNSTLIGNLQISDSASASSSDTPTLVLAGTNVFMVDDSGSGSSADNVTLTQGGGALAIDGSGSVSSADINSLIGNLQIANSGSDSSADNLALTFNGGTFVISDSGSASSVDIPTMIGTLGIDDSVSASSADNVTLSTGGGTFTIQDSGSASFANVIVISEYTPEEWSEIDKRIIMWINVLGMFIICFLANAPPH